jgi:glyoxylate/hydroxypyruvate reductase A
MDQHVQTGRRVTMEIGLCIPLPDAQVSRLRAAVVPHTLTVVGAEESIECEIVFGNLAPKTVETCKSLRWIQLESVGFGEYSSLPCLKNGSVAMTNLAGFFAVPVAESILAGVLALYRGMDQLIVLKEQRLWVGDLLRPQITTLQGANVVLFGYGSINRRIELLLQPFGCRIARFSSQWHAGELDAALLEADVVISTVPHTPATVGIFDARRLRLMKGAIFCSFGRGSAVDEDALASVLDEGVLRGAVVDVTSEEPLPDGHRFWRCPNLLLTQHTAGGSADELDRKIDFFLANLQRFDGGRPLESLVDLRRGY